MRNKFLALTTCVLICVGALASCGDDGSDAGPSAPVTTPSDTTTPEPSASPTSADTGDDTGGLTIAATVRGNDIEPNGERLEVGVGEPITINVDSDRDGELHVHSTPEQELAYHKGTTTLTLTIKTPGIVEIEDHVADKVLVSLEVS